MKNLSVLTLLLLFSLSLLVAEEARFMKSPDIRGNKIVFTYEGDLWLASASGGNATRITTSPGNEFAAKFSPDGKWIAFSAQYDGSLQAYRIPSDGGVPVRLTYTPGAAQVVAWARDGKRIVVRSMFENFITRDPNLFWVTLDGSTPPQRFPTDRGRLCSFNADGTKMLYQRRGDEEYYWKRYRGGRYPDIWLYDFNTNAFSPVTETVAKNAYPMWIGDAMFYVNDEATGVSNLVRMDLATRKITQITSYTDVDVMMPSTDGSSIIFLHDGYLHTYDVASGKVQKLSITVSSDKWTQRSKYISPKDFLQEYSISNDGETVLAEARGDLFSIPTGKGTTRNLSQTAGTRERFPRLSPDGKTVAFYSDRSGEYQIYTQPLGGGEWTQLTTTLDRAVYHLEWSPDGKKILFGNKDFAIFILDVATKKITQVDASNQMKNDEFFWEISDYAWSPDGKWIAYSFVQYNRNSTIFLYEVATGKKVAVTDDFYDNLHPRFDANGDYLYFTSSRNFDLHMDFYEDNHVVATPYTVMALQLRAGEKPPFADPAITEKAVPPTAFRVDVEGLSSRLTPLPVSAGNYFSLRAAKGKVLWTSVDAFTEDEYEEIFKPGGAKKWKLHIFDVEKQKEVVMEETISSFALSDNSERIIVRRGGDLFTASVADAYQNKAVAGAVKLTDMLYHVDYQQEWNQIFTDTWRWYRDFFYDANMHGRDWNAMGTFYRAYIPSLQSREDLNWLLSQMVGELCVSHTYVGGGDAGPLTAPTSPVFTGMLGADIQPDAKAGYYRLATIYGATAYNADLKGPLARPDIRVKEGDYLLAINGTPLRVPTDFWKLLQVTAGQKVRVTVNERPTMEGARTYEVLPVRNEQQLRYHRWIADNIAHVTKASDGKLGYMHINAMGAGGVGEFDKYWRAFRYKEGVIIDVRRNGGGWTEYFLIDKLERKVTSYNVLRNMVPFRYPGTAGNGNYVVISNENNGSDGEAFVDHFKARKLGTVVGVPSWGGLVGILNGQATIDNGTVHQSNNAFFGADGKWIVENHGADPDIVVDNDPGSMNAGKDAQLDAAIKEALRKMEAAPFKFAPMPPYPKK